MYPKTLKVAECDGHIFSMIQKKRIIVNSDTNYCLSSNYRKALRNKQDNELSRIWDTLFGVSNSPRCWWRESEWGNLWGGNEEEHRVLVTRASQHCCLHHIIIWPPWKRSNYIKSTAILILDNTQELAEGTIRLVRRLADDWGRAHTLGSCWNVWYTFQPSGAAQQKGGPIHTVYVVWVTGRE